MNKKVLSILVPALAILLAVLIVVFMAIPFQYSWNDHTHGVRVINAFGFFKEKSESLRWYDYQKGGDFHVVQVAMIGFNIALLVLVAGLVGVGVASFILRDNKVLALVLKILVIVTIVLTFIVFAASIAAAIVTLKFDNEVRVFTPYVYAPLLACAIVDLVFMGKLKKAE